MYSLTLPVQCRSIWRRRTERKLLLSLITLTRVTSQPTHSICGQCTFAFTDCAIRSYCEAYKQTQKQTTEKTGGPPTATMNRFKDKHKHNEKCAWQKRDSIADCDNTASRFINSHHFSSSSYQYYRKTTETSQKLKPIMHYEFLVSKITNIYDKSVKK